MSESRTAYELRINEVINFVEAHYSEPLALERMADVAHFSPFHFHRIFRGAVGESPHAYLTRIRLEKAIAQMNHGPNRTLNEIAIDCGFASGSHFSRTFKEAYGFSPKSYSPERFAKESKIRQDLLPNTGYASRMPSDQPDLDHFRVAMVDRPTTRIAYVRVIGGNKPDQIVAGLERLLDWSRSRGLSPESQLIGRSRDNATTTPMGKYRYDWCIEIPDDMKADREVSYGRIPGKRFGMLHCQGDIYKVFRAWSYLYTEWLPDSGYQPADEAAMELFHGEHELSANATFDLDCCIPIEPLVHR